MAVNKRAPHLIAASEEGTRSLVTVPARFEASGKASPGLPDRFIEQPPAACPSPRITKLVASERGSPSAAVDLSQTRRSSWFCKKNCSSVNQRDVHHVASWPTGDPN